jgi:hypothetical protein
MRPRVWILLALLFVSAVSPAHAQRTRPQRGASFDRVTTARRAEAPRGPGTYTETAVRGGGPTDPLEPYTAAPTAVPGTPAAYAPGPRPARRGPARQTEHSYFPTMRTGQGANRNVAGGGRGGRCTEGRAAFLARGAMGLGMAPALPGPSLGMPRP